MSRTVIATILLAGLVAAAPASAEPGGCLKYGAAGAVAGHMVHHGVKGFMAGCAVGMVRRHEYRKQMREQARDGVAARPGADSPDDVTSPNPVAR